MIESPPINEHSTLVAKASNNGRDEQGFQGLKPGSAGQFSALEGIRKGRSRLEKKAGKRQWPKPLPGTSRSEFQARRSQTPAWHSGPDALANHGAPPTTRYAAAAAADRSHSRLESPARGGHSAPAAEGRAWRPTPNRCRYNPNRSFHSSVRPG